MNQTKLHTMPIWCFFQADCIHKKTEAKPSSKENPEKKLKAVIRKKYSLKASIVDCWNSQQITTIEQSPQLKATQQNLSLHETIRPTIHNPSPLRSHYQIYQLMTDGRTDGMGQHFNNSQNRTVSVAAGGVWQFVCPSDAHFSTIYHLNKVSFTRLSSPANWML